MYIYIYNKPIDLLIYLETVAGFAQKLTFAGVKLTGVFECLASERLLEKRQSCMKRLPFGSFAAFV
jgi:hypothetical protein